MNTLRKRSNTHGGSLGLTVNDVDVDHSSHYGFLPERQGMFSTSKRRALHLPAVGNQTLIIIGFLFIIGPWVYRSSCIRDLRDLRKQIFVTQKSQRRLVADMKRVKEDFEKVSMELSTQEDINHELLSKVHDLGDNFDMDSNVYQQHRELEEKYLKRIEELETGLAKKLSGMATIKYGNGPYHVVVHLSNEPLPGVGTSFMIETAPASIMPLSVGHFLRLVERELWNGLILLHRFEGSNVVHTAEISGDTMKLSPYNFDEDPQLRLPFIEKNDEYPLVKYSVGFEGNPGGPNFFILMDDFSTQHTVFGNTPFGKVIHGEKVLDAIVNMRGQSPDMFRIDSIFVLPTEETNGK